MAGAFQHSTGRVTWSLPFFSVGHCENLLTSGTPWLCNPAMYDSGRMICHKASGYKELVV